MFQDNIISISLLIQKEIISTMTIFKLFPGRGQKTYSREVECGPGRGGSLGAGQLQQTRDTGVKLSLLNMVKLFLLNIIKLLFLDNNRNMVNSVIRKLRDEQQKREVQVHRASLAERFPKRSVTVN